MREPYTFRVSMQTHIEARCSNGSKKDVNLLLKAQVKFPTTSERVGRDEKSSITLDWLACRMSFLWKYLRGFPWLLKGATSVRLPGSSNVHPEQKQNVPWFVRERSSNLWESLSSIPKPQLIYSLHSITKAEDIHNLCSCDKPITIVCLFLIGGRASRRSCGTWS